MSFYSLNKVTLIGYLGENPNLLTTSGNKKIAKFSLATNTFIYDKTTEKKSIETEWHNVLIINQNIIQYVVPYLKRGSKVFLEGSLKTQRHCDDERKYLMILSEVIVSFGNELKILSTSDSAKTKTATLKKNRPYTIKQGMESKPESTNVKLKTIFSPITAKQEVMFDDYIPF